MTRQLTPEAEAHLERWYPGGGDGLDQQELAEERASLASIEASAIARDREGLVEVVARNMHEQRAHFLSGACSDCRREARRLLAIPETQADPLCHREIAGGWCGHRQSEHRFFRDSPDDPCTKCMCPAYRYPPDAIPEAWDMPSREDMGR